MLSFQREFQTLPVNHVGWFLFIKSHIIFRAYVVEILVLVSNGMIFQNDNVSLATKNVVAVVIVIVITGLMILGLSSEVRKRMEARKLSQNVMKTQEMPSGVVSNVQIQTVTTS
jgi:hypothetical protein